MAESSAPPPPPPPPPLPISDDDGAPKKDNNTDPPPPPPPPAAKKPVTRSPTKWKQLPFPGRGVGAKPSPSKPSSTSTSTTNPPAIQLPSPISQKNSRKAPSSSPTPSPAKKRSRPSPTAAGFGGGSISRSVNRSNSGRYAPPSKYANINNLLTDSISPNLFTLFIGLNPGIQTATSGHAYAHPSNLFWRLLHRSGCTPRLCKPTEDGDMPRLYNLGLTNIVSRPTKDGAELSKGEMDEGVAELERKIALYKPESVALVGKSIWESVWRVRHGRGIKKEEFRYGWQGDEERMGKGKGTGKAVGKGKGKGMGGFFGGSVKQKDSVVVDDDDDEGGNPEGEDKKWMGARVFVATTTSGLAASMSLREKEEIWAQLGSWVEERRAERAKAAAVKESELAAESELVPEEQAGAGAEAEAEE